MKSIIVAMDRNNGIGADNDLLWGRDLPGDLAHFRRMTKGASVIMGRKTFESMGRRPLPNRENIVVSRTPTGIEGVLTANSLASAYALARYPVFICGGERIYREALETVDRLIVTHVDAEFAQADVFFPAIDPAIWHEISREHHDIDERNKFAFDIVMYQKQ